MAKPSYQMLGILSGDREMALPPSTEIKLTKFCGEKKYNHDAVFRGVYQLRE